MKMAYHKILAAILISFLCFEKTMAQEENYEQTQIKSSPALNDTMPTPESASADREEKEKPVSNKKFDPSKLRIGLSNFGFQIGSYYNYNFIFLQATPTVGYIFLKDRLELGTGPIFIYQRYKDVYSQEKFNLFTGGASFYTRGYIWKGLFAQVQYDFVNKPSIYDFNRRVNVNHLLLGAGYSTPIGNAGSFFISAMFNVINSDESIYRGTFGDFPLILNIGFGLGVGGRNR
jgi:hypothetical protein